MNTTATKVLNAIQAKFPNQFEFKRKTLHDVAAELGYGTKDYKDLIGDPFKVRKGLYNYASLSPISGKVTEKSAILTLAKKIEKEVKKAKKPAKAPAVEKTEKSDRAWKGKNILDGTTSEKETPNTAGNYGTVYAERDGVGYCYQNGEVVSSNNYNNRKA